MHPKIVINHFVLDIWTLRLPGRPIQMYRDFHARVTSTIKLRHYLYVIVSLEWCLNTESGVTFANCELGTIFANNEFGVTFANYKFGVIFANYKFGVTFANYKFGVTFANYKFGVIFAN